MNSPLSNMCIAQTHSSFTHFSETVMTYPPGCFLDCTTSSHSSIQFGLESEVCDVCNSMS